MKIFDKIIEEIFSTRGFRIFSTTSPKNLHIKLRKIQETPETKSHKEYILLYPNLPQIPT